MITPNQHEKNEWSRMAQAAYRTGEHNAIGHRYSVAASLPHEGRVTAGYFDELQQGYRAWLCFNDFDVALVACLKERDAKRYKVAGRRTLYTREQAFTLANRIAERTGVIVSIEAA